MEKRDPVTTLGGTALRVYLYLVIHRRPVGVREVQRALGFRSPSTARHHLERLVELGLVEKTSEGYIAKSSGVLGLLYFVTYGRFIPRLLVVTAFLAASFTTYLILPNTDPAAALVMAIVLVFLARETIHFYKYAKLLESFLMEGEEQPRR